MQALAEHAFAPEVYPHCAPDVFYANEQAVWAKTSVVAEAGFAYAQSDTVSTHVAVPTKYVHLAPPPDLVNELHIAAFIASVAPDGV